VLLRVSMTLTVIIVGLGSNQIWLAYGLLPTSGQHMRCKGKREDYQNSVLYCVPQLCIVIGAVLTSALQPVGLCLVFYATRQVCREALVNTAELSFFLFYQYTAFSSHAEDDCQMYSRGSVVGETSLIDPDILPTPPLIFTAGGGAKSTLFGFIFNITWLWVTCIWNCRRDLESETNVVSIDDLPMSWPSLVKFGPRTSEKALSRWLNIVHVGLRRLHVHGPGFNPRSGRVIQPEITNAHALRLLSQTGKRVRRCPL